MASKKQMQEKEDDAETEWRRNPLLLLEYHKHSRAQQAMQTRSLAQPKFIGLMRFCSTFRYHIPVCYKRFGSSHTLYGDYCIVDELPLVIKSYFPQLRKFYIRPCYKLLYDEFKHNLKECTRTGKPKIVVIKGIPKIGKSIFGLYFLLMLVKEINLSNFSFAVQYESNKFFFFQRGESLFEFNVFYCNSLSIGVVQPTLIISDFEELVDTYCNRGLTMIITHPDYHRYERVWNSIESKSCSIMNPWNFEEILFLDHNIPNWYIRYCKYGGVPYYLFNYFDFEMDKTRSEMVDLQFSAAIQTNGSEIVHKVLCGENLETGSIYKSNGFMIVHISSSGSDKQRSTDNSKVTFASDIVIEILLRAYGAVFRNILETLERDKSPRVNKLGYYFFEKFCLFVHPISSKSIRVYSAFDETDMVIEVPATMRKLNYEWRSSVFAVNILYIAAYHQQTHGISFCVSTVEGKKAMLFFNFSRVDDRKLVVQVIADILKSDGFRDANVEQNFLINFSPLSISSSRMDQKESASLYCFNLPETFKYYFCSYNLSTKLDL